MNDYRALRFDELCSALEQPAPTQILFHRGPDADAVGSAFALRLLLAELGSPAYCLCANEVPERLRFLSAPWQESVLPDSLPADFAAQRVLSVDVASPNQLGELWELYGDRVDIMIDHHQNGSVFADHFVLGKAAATGEILFDLVKYFAEQGRFHITDALCVLLYSAISSDTGGFRYSNVTPETHERAAQLVASGIDCAAINHQLFEGRSMEQLKAISAGISNLHVFGNGSVAVILFPYALKAALGLADEHLETLVEIARSLHPETAGEETAF